MARDDEAIAEAAYDELAANYREVAESNVYNADLEFPATSAMIPDVDGAQVLDAGCGAGRYTEWLLEQGATVVGMDVSERMLAQARDRVGERATFHQASLEAPLSFAADGAFAGVVSSLVLDYVEDWESTFTEFSRVLDDGGFFVFSVRHPLDVFDPEASDSYFAVELAEADWAVGVPYYRRPLSAMFEPLRSAGFRIDEVVEPQPTERFREREPDLYETESKEPVFFCVRATNE